MQNLLPLDGELYYYSNFLSSEQSHFFFEIIKAKVHWEQPIIKLFGKNYLSPRLTAWYGDSNAVYKYSGVINIPQNWFKELWDLKCLVENFIGKEFNSVLINWYRNEKDSMGWHSDDEKELGKNPIIASVSLGTTRKMIFRHRKNKKQKFTICLENGSLLLMQGSIQHYWEHAIPKETQPCSGRMNLTFRNVLG